MKKGNVCPLYKEEMVKKYVKNLERATKKNYGMLWMKKYPLKIRVTKVEHVRRPNSAEVNHEKKGPHGETYLLENENSKTKKKLNESIAKLYEQLEELKEAVENIDAIEAERNELLKDY